jgi:hypothetical protein
MKIMDKIKKVLNDWFTEVDNKTFDITKVLAVFSIGTGIFLAIFSVVYKAQAFNYQDYGLGTAALFAGLGVALGLKKDSDKSIGE